MKKIILLDRDGIINKKKKKRNIRYKMERI